MSLTSTSNQKTHSKYRPDIDGLRAIAVITVLFFHIGFDLFEGGFIGVDVFFVISGYLITGVIRDAVRERRFTLLNFYGRRLLRLQPALLTTAIACIAIGYLLMDPASLKELSKSASHAILATSNFYFWINQGYFDAAAHTQVLLHTWSLAVEWQFYLLWPIVVWTAISVSERFLLYLLVFITLVSLISSQVMLSHDSSAAYLLMPFRVFELSIGALLLFTRQNKFSSQKNSIILFIGITLIVASSVLLSPSSPFPGLLALAPSLGAAACIYAGNSENIGSSLLRYRPLIYIGVTSYSIYLVHWPIFVFYKYYVARELFFLEKLGLLLFSLIVGAALYHSVEKIFLKKKSSTHAYGYLIIAVSTIILLIVFKDIVNKDGLKSRVPPEYQELVHNPSEFHIKNYGGHGYSSDSLLGSKSSTLDAFIVGDSLSLQYASGLEQILLEENISVRGIFAQGCYLSKSYSRLSNGVLRTDCQETYASITQLLNSNTKVPLILAQHWAGYKDLLGDNSGQPVRFSSDEEYEDFIISNLKEWRGELGDRPLIIIGSTPYIKNTPSAASCLLRPRHIQQPCERIMHFDLTQTASYSINTKLKNFSKKTSKTYYIDPAETLCPNDTCSPLLQGQLIFSDNFHLSKEGSKFVSKSIVESLLKAIEE